MRNCSECAKPFTRKRHDQVFCSPGCRFEDHNRAMRRGREAYRAMYHWRLGQGKGQRGSLISVISGLAKLWVEEDKAAGRSPPPLPEELEMRLVNARTGYVKREQRYVRDEAGAASVMVELGSKSAKQEEFGMRYQREINDRLATAKSRLLEALSMAQDNARIARTIGRICGEIEELQTRKDLRG